MKNILPLINILFPHFYLFPLSFSDANAFKLLNEDPGGRERILLWLKSKWRNLTSFSTTSGTWINSFHDKLMVSRILWSKPSNDSSFKVWRPTFRINNPRSFNGINFVDLNSFIIVQMGLPPIKLNNN